MADEKEVSRHRRCTFLAACLVMCCASLLCVFPAISFADGVSVPAERMPQEFLNQLWAAATQGAPARQPGQLVLPGRQPGQLVLPGKQPGQLVPPGKTSGSTPPVAPKTTGVPAPKATAPPAPVKGAASQAEPARPPNAPDGAGSPVTPATEQDRPPSAADGAGAPVTPATEPARPPSAADGAGAPAAPAAEPAGKDGWAPPQGAAAKINLFGTIEFRSILKDAPQWERVVAEEKKKPGLDNPVGLAASWPALRDKLKGQKRMEQIEGVNKFFNRFPYRTDMEAYGVMDYWATPAEFMKNSGDCEDYSIIKYYALKQLGVDPDSMRIVVVTDVIRNLAHAVLAVYNEGNAYILDNLSNLALPHTRLTHYRPQFSVNENYRWVHMLPKK